MGLMLKHVASSFYTLTCANRGRVLDSVSTYAGMLYCVRQGVGLWYKCSEALHRAPLARGNYRYPARPDTSTVTQRTALQAMLQSPQMASPI